MASPVPFPLPSVDAYEEPARSLSQVRLNHKKMGGLTQGSPGPLPRLRLDSTAIPRQATDGRHWRRHLMNVTR